MGKGKMDKKELKFYITVIAVSLIGSWAIQTVAKSVIDGNIKKQREQIEFDLRAQGLLDPRRPQKVIYMPLDREDTGRQDSTGVFLKTAKKEFGTQQTGGFETVDYASQADEYDQRVREIKQQEAQRLAEQKKQQAELDKKMGKTPSAHNTVKKNNKQNTGGTVINRLQTSGRNNNKSTMFKK